MGLQDLLLNGGSSLSKHDGATPPTNPLTLKTSKLHSTAAGEPGYSLDGADKAEVSRAYNSYNDGAINPLPQPSGLDLNGKTPAGYSNPETGQTFP